MPSILAALLFLPSWGSRASEPVWIDTDISIGSPLRDVDDAYAILIALHSRSCRITGISTSYGNASRRFADRAARDLIGQFGSLGQVSNADIYSGADCAEDLGRETSATRALARALRQRRLTYLAIGPLTNLATLLRMHPDLASRVQRIVFVSGTFPGERLTLGQNKAFHFHDANTLKDPQAVKEILRTKIPVLLVPVSVAQHLTLTHDDLRRLAASGASGSYLSSRSRTWMWFWRNIGGADGAPVFDAAGVVALFKPNFLITGARYAGVNSDHSLTIRKVRSSREERAIECCLEIKPEATAFCLKKLQDP